MRVGAADVNESDGVVSPMGDCHPMSVGRSRNHLGQRSSLHEPNNLVGLRIDDGNSRGVLRVDVVIASVIRHPKVFAAMRECALDRFAEKGVEGDAAVHVVSERIEPRGFAP